jgi:hypothetical protein
MADLRIKVHTPGGESHPIEAPSDIKVEDFVLEVVNGLNLPKVDADGHQIAWKIDDKNTGRSLDYQSSLDANGVQAGHDLYLRREPIAGGSAWRTERSFIPRNREYPNHDNSSV